MREIEELKSNRDSCVSGWVVEANYWKVWSHANVNTVAVCGQILIIKTLNTPVLKIIINSSSLNN